MLILYHVPTLPIHSSWRGIVALVCMLTASDPVRAETTVAIELLLALDSSASMDASEFALQLEGLALAFRDPEVLQAVKNLQPLGVAIAVSQWGGPGDHRLVVPFTHVETERDSKAFGFRISLGNRTYTAASTSIVTAISEGVALIDTNGFDGQRKIIDISGDGLDNSGLDLEAARQMAASTRVIINGLAIEQEQPGLSDYYRDNVIIGSDSFVVTAQGFSDFARAIKEKLLRELRPLGS